MLVIMLVREATKKVLLLVVRPLRVVGWKIRSLLAGLLQYLAKNMAVLVFSFFCLNQFLAILR